MAYGKIDRAFLKKFHFEYMILDEAHNLKNSESARYQNLLRIKVYFDHPPALMLITRCTG